MAVTALLELLVDEVYDEWVDLTPDIIRDPIRWKRGIFGRGPLDRIAEPGTLSFTLDNTDQNSAAQASLYSPGHVHCLDGWRHGAIVRLRLSDGTNTRYVFRGRLKFILPDPGVAGLRAVTCIANDWLAELAEADAANLELRTNVRSDELMRDLVDVVATPPLVVDFDEGEDLYPFAFDDLGDAVKATPVAQDVMQSELGFLYMRGDTTGGETLRMINRETRAVTLPVASFTKDDFHPQADAFRVPSTVEDVFNEIEVLTVPRRVGDTDEDLLVQLDGAIEVEAGATEEIFVDYRDPDNEAEYVGGIDVQAMDPNTDWTANAAEDGSGADVTASFAVTASPLGSRAIIELTNNSAATGYVRGPGGADGLQVRGRALRRYRTVSSLGTNDASIARVGRRPLPSPILMPYQPNRTVGKQAAEYLAFVHGGLSTTPERIQLATDADDELQAHGILRDIGDVVEVEEEVTGADEALVFINGLEQELSIEGRLYTWWTPAPREAADAVLDESVYVHDRLYPLAATPEDRIGFMRIGFGEIG